MKRIRLVVNLIASWQLLLALVFLVGESYRVSQMSWGTQHPQSPLIHDLLSLDKITWRWFDTGLSLFILISIAGFIGLIFKKNWGRLTSNVASLMMIIIVIIWTVNVLSFDHYGSANIFIDYVLPVIIALILVAPGILSTIYLTKPYVKEFFKQKPQIEPVVPVSSN